MKCIDCGLNESESEQNERCSMCGMLGAYYQYEVWDGNEWDLDEFRKNLTPDQVALIRMKLEKRARKGRNHGGNKKA